jgi:hypothetical protein
LRGKGFLPFFFGRRQPTPDKQQQLNETGSSIYVAISSQMDAADSAHSIPYAKTSGVDANTAGLATPPEMVLDTLPPRRMAPSVSMTAAMTMAHLSLSVCEPTEVANCGGCGDFFLELALAGFFSGGGGGSGVRLGSALHIQQGPEEK